MLLLSTVFKAIPWTTGSKSVRQAAAGSRTCLFVRGGWDPAGCTHQGHILSPAEKSRLGDSLWSRHRPPTAGPCPEPVSPDAVDPVPVPLPLSFRLGSSVNKNHWVPVPAVSHPGFLKKAGDQNEAAPRDPQNRRYTAFPFRDLRTAKNRHWVPVPAVSHPGFLKKAGDQNEAAPRDPQNRRYTAFPFRDLRTAKNRKPPALAFRFSGNGLKKAGDQNEAAPRDPQNRRYTAFPFRDLRTAKNRKPPALAFRFSGNGLPAGGFFLLSLFQ